ncbi:hypothetical protein PYCC9005_003569 [Savitreella phatthalungensis]
MFGFGESHDAYQQVYNGDERHEGKFSHELIAGAASFEAMKVFEDRQRREGKPVSHQFAKELLAGIAGGEADKLFETKGLDYIDQERARNDARKNAERLYDEHYGGYDEYNPQEQRPHEHIQRYGDY